MTPSELTSYDPHEGETYSSLVDAMFIGLWIYCFDVKSDKHSQDKVSELCVNEDGLQ